MNSVNSDKDFLKSRLINPNLGHPLILNIDKRLKNKEFEHYLLFASEIPHQKEFEKWTQHRIGLVPLFEYRWKLRSLLEKEKRKYELRKIEEIEKKVTIWDKIKRIFQSFRKSKRESGNTHPISSNGIQDFKEEQKLKKLKLRTYRGEIIKAIVLHVEKVEITRLDDLNYDEYYSPRPYLLRQSIISGIPTFYKVKISFTLDEEVIEWLRRYNFIMFDIIIKNEAENDSINYHSIVISKNNWKNINIVHATDLHLAERNDRIYEIVKKWMAIFRNDQLKNLVEGGLKTFSFFSKLFKKKPQEPVLALKPLFKRIINPNNNFRKFIKMMNRKALKNELDFIVLSGDLIDFTALSNISKDLKKLIGYDYEHSNWKIFKEILLNFPQKRRRGMKEGEELLCPIFTIPGNHDYRPYPYDLRWGNLYRKMGLNANEALALNDELAANPISAITKSFRALKPYLVEVNSALDFSLKLGKNNFIFLNSGGDSFKHLADFISGHPSVTGLTNKQIKYLEMLLNDRVEKDDNNFLFIHGPPVNPSKHVSFLERIGSTISAEKMKTEISSYRESLIMKKGESLAKARIDLKFNVKHGTISSNWEKLIAFCKNHTLLTLSGHTHELKEFRLAEPIFGMSKVYDAPPFILKKIENPAAIFYDLYSEMYINAKDIKSNAPFVLQTPALGLGGYHNPKLAGAYREIIIRKNKLQSFKVKFINR